MTHEDKFQYILTNQKNVNWKRYKPTIFPYNQSVLEYLTEGDVNDVYDELLVYEQLEQDYYDLQYKKQQLVEYKDLESTTKKVSRLLFEIQKARPGYRFNIFKSGLIVEDKTNVFVGIYDLEITDYNNLNTLDEAITDLQERISRSIFIKDSCYSRGSNNEIRFSF